MRKILLAGLLVCTGGVWKASAQQQPQFTHYMFNTLVYNPAYAGISESICANFVGHNQYGSFSKGAIDNESAPKTMTFDVNGRIPMWLNDPTSSAVGVGAHYYNDVEEWVGTNGIYLDGSYRINTLNRGTKKQKPFLFNGGEFSVGLSVGMVQKSLEAQWKAKDLNDPRLPGTASTQAFDMGFGLYYSRPQKYYIGISALHLTAPKLEWVDTKSAGQIATYNLQRVFFLTGGYTYQLNPNIELKPSTLIKYDQAKINFGVNMMGVYKKTYWAAVNYRAERLNALSIMAGLQGTINDKTGWRAGVSYDIPTKYMPQFGPTLEIMAGICYKPKMGPGVMVPPQDPRHLGHDPY